MNKGTWSVINDSSATRIQKDALVRACKISVIHAIKNGNNVLVVISDSNNGIVGVFTTGQHGITIPGGRIFIGKRGGIHSNELTF